MIRLNSVLANTYASWTWKIGRAVTKPAGVVPQAEAPGGMTFLFSVILSAAKDLLGVGPASRAGSRRLRSRPAGGTYQKLTVPFAQDDRITARIILCGSAA